MDQQLLFGNNDDDDDFWSTVAAATTTTTAAAAIPQPTAVTANFISSDDDENDNRNDDEVNNGPKVFDRYFDSSSSDELLPSVSYSSFNGVDTAGKKLDYMIQFLDRKLSTTSSATASGSGGVDEEKRRYLPEFVGKGGGAGCFRVPSRAAVHPNRPPSLELVPHPLRESQIALRTMVCNESQLWVGSESGVRFMNLADAYSCGMPRCGKYDEDLAGAAAPFYESVDTAPTMCMVADAGNKLIWSGHKDGKIRSWTADQSLNGSPFKEGVSWVAHRGSVLSMVISSYGDLWSCSEDGAIKLWPWESIEKSLSLTMEERHKAALMVERSYIDLRSQVSVNGFSNVLSSDVRFLLSDNARSEVWSAGYQSFALWDARTRELLKVFNIYGQTENRLDMASLQDISMEDEMKMKIAGGPKILLSAGSFLQRSRNALLGAADAVRRVAVKGAFADDNRRTEALVRTMDGMVWTGGTGGLLVQWDAHGNRLQDFQYHSFAVQCFCTFGSRIWVGYISGIVQVLNLNGQLLGEWMAHSGAVIKMAVGSGYVFTLASHGGIRGWNATSPGPLDSLISSELAGKEFLYTRLENIKVLTGTWNVAEGKASHDSLISWLGSAASDVGIVVVGLQEVEMGAGVFAMSAAKETVGLEGSAVGQWWLDMIDKTLGEGLAFERVGSRQLAGLLIAIWVRTDLKAYVGDVDAGAVPCGFGRAIGNKGAVGLRMRVYGRIMCFVNCHFAAHLEAVNRRNADFDHVYQNMTFSRQSNPVNSAAGVSSAAQMFRMSNAMGSSSVDVLPEIAEADLVVFFGDFNYRLYGISYDEARDFISQRSFDWLRENDQLRAEMEAGNVFQGMREGVIRFPPTYKFERHQAGLAGYDSGEKKRIPAWCDRILYRDSRSQFMSECCLECPVVSSILQYEACMDVTDSDHKPVRCILNVDIARVDELVRRQEFGEIMESNEKVKCLLERLCKVPETIVSTNNIILQNQDTSILRITNKCGRTDALFEIICKGQSSINDDGQAYDHRPRGSFGFPRWLQVSPASGIVKADDITEVLVHHQEYHTFEEFVDGVSQNSWCEDSRDKEVILVVKVYGECSTQSRNHRIRVRRSFPTKNHTKDNTANTPKGVQGSVLHRSNLQNINSSNDVVDQLKSLLTP